MTSLVLGTIIRLQQDAAGYAFDPLDGSPRQVAAGSIGMVHMHLDDGVLEVINPGMNGEGWRIEVTAEQLQPCGKVTGEGKNAARVVYGEAPLRRYSGWANGDKPGLLSISRMLGFASWWRECGQALK